MKEDIKAVENMNEEQLQEVTGGWMGSALPNGVNPFRSKTGVESEPYLGSSGKFNLRIARGESGEVTAYQKYAIKTFDSEIQAKLPPLKK